MATLTHAPARHAHPHIPGHIMDIGAVKRRRAQGRPTYGKHGNGHVAGAESRTGAILARARRTLRGSYPTGAHGIPAEHPSAARVIGATLGRRYNPLTHDNAAYQAGVRYRTIVGG